MAGNHLARIDWRDVSMLLRIALGTRMYDLTTENRFRNTYTGDTKQWLDSRIDKHDDWVVEYRTIVKTHWEADPV